MAWAITGVGMWFIVNTFRVLTNTKPHMQDGLYAYARTGFGDFVGFLVAYGYWLCNCFSLVAYGVLIMSTLDIFMPGTFTNGNNIASTVASSLILWLMFIVASLGTKTGAIINVAGTICKMIPVLVFVVALAAVFKTGVFVRGFWGLSAQGTPLGFDVHRIGAQVSDSMLVTLWLFIGMEGAVVVSGSARHPRDVSRATTAGYLTVLVLYILVSLLPLGVYSASQVAQMPNPSMSVIMEQRFGQWGSIMVNIGVIISVVFAWLVWMIMISQMPLYAARDGIYPRSFRATNRFGAPSTGLVWTAITCQLLFVLCHFVNGDAWEVMISITSVMAMPCYLLCCVYLWKVAVRERTVFRSAVARHRALATGILGTLFSLFLVYSAGLRYLMMACALYAIGLPLLVVARRQRRLARHCASCFRIGAGLYCRLSWCWVCAVSSTPCTVACSGWHDAHCARKGDFGEADCNGNRGACGCRQDHPVRSAAVCHGHYAQTRPCGPWRRVPRHRRDRTRARHHHLH